MPTIHIREEASLIVLEGLCRTGLWEIMNGKNWDRLTTKFSVWIPRLSTKYNFSHII